MAAQIDENDDEPYWPLVLVGDDYVAVQWHMNAPWHVMRPDGSVTERFTLPSNESAVALPLPKGPAA